MTTPPTAEQQQIIDAFRDGDHLVVEAGAGTGKALRDDQPVLTPSGWKPISTLQIGDQVIGSTGEPVQVTGVYPQGVRPLFEVVTSDAVTIVADADHLWLTETTVQRQHKRSQWKTRTTADIAATLTVPHAGLDRPNHYLPMLSEPVGGPVVDCPLDTWLVGVLIGDGNLTGRAVGLSNPDQQLLRRVRQVLPAGTVLKPQSARTVGKDWRITGERSTRPGRRGFYNPVAEALEQLGLRGCASYEKRIPEVLLHASAQQRHEVLTGLLDTDGHVSASHHVEFSTTSPYLADQVPWLVQSLGGTVHVTYRPAPTYTYRGERRTGRPAWRISMSLPASVFPFAHSAKADRYEPRSKYPPRRQIVDVRPTEAGPATCISVDAPNHLYVTAGCVLTHNTSTLRMLAAAEPQRQGVYIAYNRAIAQEAQASFPESVTCKTAHSLAFGAVGRHYKHRLNGPRVPAYVTAKILGLNDPIKLGDLMLAPQQQARLTMDTITRFCYSADERIGRRHVPHVNGLDRAGQTELARYLTPVAQRAWEEDITQTNGQLRFQHDHYLKMWTMSRPQLPADYVLLDEAQDSNGCVAGLVTNQNAQRIWVGDQSQSIYGWRGATDAMEHAPGTRLYLSQSFRFGPAVAREANKWLELLDAPLRLTGFDQIDSAVGHILDVPDAVLCRTNAGAITQVISNTGRGLKTALVGGGEEIRQFAEAAEMLQAGRGTYHPDLMAFSRWSEVKAYVKESGESDLRVLVQLVDTHGPRGLISIVDSLADERDADVVVSTAHKAKGREWLRVRVANDFPEPKPTEDGEDGGPARDEAMLAYVAVTRAREMLDREGLAWVDRYAEPAELVQREVAPPSTATGTTSAPAEVPDNPDDGLTPECVRCGRHYTACECVLMPDRRPVGRAGREVKRLRRDGKTVPGELRGGAAR